MICFIIDVYNRLYSFVSVCSFIVSVCLLFLSVKKRKRRTIGIDYLYSNWPGSNLESINQSTYDMLTSMNIVEATSSEDETPTHYQASTIVWRGDLVNDGFRRADAAYKEKNKNNKKVTSAKLIIKGPASQPSRRRTDTIANYLLSIKPNLKAGAIKWDVLIDFFAQHNPLWTVPVIINDEKVVLTYTCALE